MRSILRRIRLILRALAHALLASAEDPRQTFAVAHHRQQQMLEKVRQAQSKLRSAKQQLIAKSGGGPRIGCLSWRSRRARPLSMGARTWRDTPCGCVFWWRRSWRPSVASYPSWMRRTGLCLWWSSV